MKWQYTFEIVIWLRYDRSQMSQIHGTWYVTLYRNSRPILWTLPALYWEVYTNVRVVQPLNKLISFYGTWYHYCTNRNHCIVLMFIFLSSVISNDGCANFRNVSETSAVEWGFRIFVWWWIWENTFSNFCWFFWCETDGYILIRSNKMQQ